MIRGPLRVIDVEKAGVRERREANRDGLRVGRVERMVLEFGKERLVLRDERDGCGVVRRREEGTPERGREGGDRAFEIVECTGAGPLGQVLIEESAKGVERRLAGLFDDGEKQSPLVAVVVVDGALRYRSLRRDGIHARPLHADVDEEVAGRGEDGCPFVRLPGPESLLRSGGHGGPFVGRCPHSTPMSVEVHETV